MVLSIVIILETLILSLILITSAEYLLTEVFFVIRYLSASTKTGVFLITLIILFAFNYFWPRFRRLGKKALPVLAVFVVGLLFGYKKYRTYYDRLQRQPKIYSISSDWSIQAKRIVIEGRAFGWAHQNSKVIADNEEFLIDSWEPYQIVAVGPLTGNFGEHQLQVILHDGKKTRKIPFEFRDPAELAKF